MARRIYWNNLRLGLLASAAVVGLAAAILTFARVGSLHGKTFHLFLTTAEARGVIRGTEVWLDGQKVGLVTKMDFGPPSGDTLNRVVMSLDVLAKVRENIRLDSRTDIRSGGSLISSPVIFLGTGTARARAVREGDTLHSRGPVDFEATSSDVARGTRELPAIILGVKRIADQLQGPKGSAGAFIAEGAPPIRKTGASVSRLMTRLSTSRGSLALMLGGASSFAARTHAALSVADSIRALLASPSTSLGRFRRDSTLLRDLGAARDELATLRALADSGDGTIGRFRRDDALRQSLDSVFHETNALFADVKKHPLRYIAF
jgi:ABC-type transporter Mla subunit MlaD